MTKTKLPIYSRNIKFLRGQIDNLSQTDWGKKFGIARGAVDHLERGNTRPNNQLTGSIAKEYKLTMETVLNIDFTSNPTLFKELQGKGEGIVYENDAIKIRDEQIADLRQQLKTLQEFNGSLLRQLEAYTSRKTAKV
jgi:transcriptional regulator with XRE-family HTH domain